MNFLNILEEIEKFDPEVYDRLDTRRKAMSQFANLGKKLTAAALPLGLSAMFNKAYGQTSSDVMDVLQFALAAEYLESTFYNLGIRNANTMGLTGRLKVGIAKISLDEMSHVFFLKAVISGMGGTPAMPGDMSVPAANRDYGIDITGGGGSGSGPLAGAFGDLDTFLAVGQAFEDMGVRAYKGQAARLINNCDVLKAALDIHAVEARHASYLRTARMRYSQGTSGDLKPWITGKNSYIPGGLGAALQPIYEAGTDPMMYPDEANHTQAGINLADIPSVSTTSLSEAFDEPLDKARVLQILGTPGSGMGTANAKFFY